MPDSELDPLFAATVDATEEAVLNALRAAADTTGRSDRIARALPHEPVLEQHRPPPRTAGCETSGRQRLPGAGIAPR